MPEVSVIIPTYNAAAYLPDALQSALAQTVLDLEVLVVDDGSTDETATLMRTYGPPVRYLPQPNGGVAAARNRGIAESRGRYVAFLDADDVWLPHKLERQLAALAGRQGFRACCTAYRVVAADLAPLRMQHSLRSNPTLEHLLTIGNVIGTPSTVLAERALFLEQGGFDPALSQCADWEMWLRLAAVTSFLYLDEPLIQYRQHGANMSRQVPLLEKDSLRVLEKGFAMPALPDSLQSRRRSAFAHTYMVLAGSYYHAGAYASSLRCLLRSLLLDPRQIGRLAGFPARAWARWQQKTISTPG